MVCAAVTVGAGFASAGVSDVLGQRKSDQSHGHFVVLAQKNADVQRPAAVEEAKQIDRVAGAGIQERGAVLPAGNEKSARPPDALQNRDAEVSEIAEDQIARAQEVEQVAGG
jgi:hypothetical protein